MGEEKNFESFIALEENKRALNKICVDEIEQSVYTKNGFPELSEDMYMDISAEFRRTIKAQELVAVICNVASALNGWRKEDGALLFTKNALYYVGNNEKDSFFIDYNNLNDVDFKNYVNDPEGVLLKNGELDYNKIAQNVELYNKFMYVANPDKVTKEPIRGNSRAGFLCEFLSISDVSNKFLNERERRNEIIMLFFQEGKEFQKDLENRVKKEYGWGKTYERLILTDKDNKKYYIPGKNYNVRVMYNFFMDYMEYMVKS